MAQLLPKSSQPDSGSDCPAVVIGDLGAAIQHDGSAATLQASADLTDALHHAAAVITPETETDGNNSVGTNTRYFLLASADASVLHNGTALASTGMVALSRKDEIFITSENGVGRYYFSDEVIPEPEAIPPDLSEDACCPRCQTSLHALSPTAAGLKDDDDLRVSRKPLIRCGGCGSLYHSHGCYDYESTCLICLAPTTGHKLWTPEELD